MGRRPVHMEEREKSETRHSAIQEGGRGGIRPDSGITIRGITLRICVYNPWHVRRGLAYLQFRESSQPDDL
eukprot:3893949-Pyramimonas_sp.AAC.4